ncbi:MAG: PAS domain S-box protein [Myxococcota bacterium]
MTELEAPRASAAPGTTLRLAGAALGAALLLMAAIAAVGARSMLESADRSVWVEHTLGVLEASENTRALLNRVEAGQREYLVSGAAAALARSEIAQREADAALRVVERLTAGNPSQRERMRELKALVEERRRIASARTEQRRRTGRAPGPADAAPERRSSRIMDSTRELLNAMQSEERDLLAHRSAELEIDHEFALGLVIFGSVSAVLVLVGAFALLRREIVQRTRAEVALARHADETDDLYNRAPCGYHSLDAQGVIVRINDTELSWLGYGRDEVVGKLRFRDFLAPDSRAVFDQSFDADKLEGSAPSIDLTLVRRDGTALPVSSRASVIRAADGRYLMSRSTVFDISERSRLQQDLDRIFELSRELVCVAGTDGHMKRLNPAWERVLGHTAAEVIAQPFIDLVHPDDREATLAAYDRQLDAGESVISFENRYRCKDGSYRVLLWNSTPVPADGSIYATAHDITERKRSEEILRAAIETSEASNRELEAFSYSVSHDLRAPLRVIDGFSGMLEQHIAGQIDAEGQRLLSVVRRSAQRMDQLIDDLLEFSRVSRSALTTQRVDMRALADEVSRELAPDAVKQPDWRIGELPAAHADPALVRQVWTNLLSNAVKFSSHREHPMIEVGSRRENGEVVYFVRDNGAGFGMQHANKLFSVFQRLHSDGEFPGTGVGLAIVQRVVARHGGSAWAEGVPDGGATFFFTLRGKQADDDADE